MYAEVAWALESLGTQVQPQIIPDPGYLPDYLSVSYDYAFLEYSLLRSSYFFFQVSYLFGAKVLPSSNFLRIRWFRRAVSFSVKLHFLKTNLSRTKVSTE